ncbi:MAG: TlpA family protein disulfide reductase [Nocardioidaceae bacterium]
MSLFRRGLLRHVATAAAAVLLGAGITSCSATVAGGGDNGYITGQGSVDTITPADRKGVPTLKGAALGGGTVSLASHRGKIVVINVWAAWCPPCRAEADALVEAARKMPDVVFIGIDSRDNNAAAQAFVRSHHIPYPSLADPDGSAMLAFYGMLAPNSLPTTMVLDTQGRIAAMVSGEITTLTLVGLVHDIASGT